MPLIESVTSRLDGLESSQYNSNNENQKKNKWILWNANGLVQRKQELEDFLHNENIDIALISETHIILWTVLKIKDCMIYTILHQSGRAQGNTTIVVKEPIQNYELEKYSEKINDGNN